MSIFANEFFSMRLSRDEIKSRCAQLYQTPDYKKLFVRGRDFNFLNEVPLKLSIFCMGPSIKVQHHPPFIFCRPVESLTEIVDFSRLAPSKIN